MGAVEGRLVQLDQTPDQVGVVGGIAGDPRLLSAVAVQQPALRAA